jgi:hypothetical protein
MADTQKIEAKIKEFYDSFARLSGQEKLYFLAQFDQIVKQKDEKDRKLYLSLLKSAREGRTYEEAVNEMRQV